MSLKKSPCESHDVTIVSRAKLPTKGGMSRGAEEEVNEWCKEGSVESVHGRDT